MSADLLLPQSTLDLCAAISSLVAPAEFERVLASLVGTAFLTLCGADRRDFAAHMRALHDGLLVDQSWILTKLASLNPSWVRLRQDEVARALKDARAHLSSASVCYNDSLAVSSAAEPRKDLDPSQSTDFAEPRNDPETGTAWSPSPSAGTTAIAPLPLAPETFVPESLLTPRRKEPRKKPSRRSHQQSKRPQGKRPESQRPQGQRSQGQRSQDQRQQNQPQPGQRQQCQRSSTKAPEKIFPTEQEYEDIKVEVDVAQILACFTDHDDQEMVNDLTVVSFEESGADVERSTRSRPEVLKVERYEIIVEEDVAQI